tara:strand:+ start:2482 stop:2967 length:486 start_codon:yes stop_codon:yes gene_type:complete
MSYKPEKGEIYQGKQVIIDADRLLFNAKMDSILLYSNKAIGFSTMGSIHFDTSDQKEDVESSNASKFVVNSPNIYLGLKFDKTLPTEPAVLGNEFDEWANELLDCIDGLMDDIVYNITYMSPSGPTGPMSSNEANLSLRRTQVKDLRSNIKYIKSKITKLS